MRDRGVACALCAFALSWQAGAYAQCSTADRDMNGVPDGCTSGSSYIAGTAGNDDLRGTIGVDCIYGFGGDDTIDGRKGDDYICGGEGIDNIADGDGADELYGEGDGDTIDGGKGSDFIDSTDAYVLSRIDGVTFAHEIVDACGLDTRTVTDALNRMTAMRLTEWDEAPPWTG